jgi:hypothetical protein
LTPELFKKTCQRRVSVLKYTKWNPYHKKEMDYSAMKSYLEKNDVHYFTFPPNSEKPIKALICHLPPDMQVEDISNIPED